MIERLLSELPNKDIFSLLTEIREWLERGAQELNVPPSVLYIVGILVAVGVGLTCYKLGKLWLGLLGAAAGYYLTGHGLILLGTDLPMVLVYALAIAVAVVMFFLAFKNFSYVFYTFMAAAGFAVVYFYTQNELFAIVGAIFLALVSVFVFRLAMIVVSSFVGSSVAVSLLSLLLPNATFLQLRAGNWVAIGLVVAMTVVLTVFQIVTTLGRKRGTALQAERSTKAERSLFPFE